MDVGASGAVSAAARGEKSQRVESGPIGAVAGAAADKRERWTKEEIGKPLGP